jgi:anti-sigma factor (TIGR02949 family)
MSPDRFTCEQVFERLEDYLDRELDADEMRMVREHLATCEQCAMEYRFESRVLEDVREKLMRIAMPESVKARVALAIEAARRDGPA